jgi:hypothetical protein
MMHFSKVVTSESLNCCGFVDFALSVSGKARDVAIKKAKR